MKRVFLNVLVLLMIISSLNLVKADEKGIYEVCDGQETLASFDNYYEADLFYRQHLNDYTNLVFKNEGLTERMEYGTVSFAKGEQWYYSLSRRASSSISTTADALYLSQTSDRIYFMIAGDVGYIGKDSAVLHPLDKTSHYYLKDGELHHAILDTNTGYYQKDLIIDAPEDASFREGQHCFSYDGRYFYDDFMVMSDDVRQDIHDNALNPDDPYFAYFMYLPYHSKTAYSAAEFDGLLSELYDSRPALYLDLNDDGANDQLRTSMLHGEAGTFIKAEQELGVNGAMLMGEAMAQSALGKDYQAVFNNNLFEHVAYDSTEEREKDCYSSISDGIRSYAEYYVNGRYANYRSSSFAGTSFGDKVSGINAAFFSDPYAGEEAASFVYRIDKKLGGKDLNSLALAFIKPPAAVYDEEQNGVLYRVPRLNTYVLVVTGESEDSYTVIPDRLSETGSVLKKDVLFVKNEDKIAPLNKEIENLEIEERETIEVSVSDKKLPDLSEIRDYSDSSFPCHIDSEIENVSVSGIRGGAERKHFFDTVYLKIRETDDNRKYDRYADFYGLEYVRSFKLSLSLNMAKIYEFDPLLVQLPIEGDDLSKIYSVYRADDELGLVKVRTQRSASFLRFIAEENGEYVIFSLNSENVYDLEDQKELITTANCAPDSAWIIMEGFGLLILITAGTILIVMHELITRRREKLWKDCRNLLVEPVSAHAVKPKN